MKKSNKRCIPTLWQLCKSDAKHDTTIDLLHTDFASMAFSRQVTRWPKIDSTFNEKGRLEQQN